jgi:signal transduction histidine kinase
MAIKSTRPKQTICWVSRRPARFESQHFQVILSHFTQQNYEIKWVEAPPSLNVPDLPAWIAEKIAPNACAVFFGDRDFDWFRTILNPIRKYPNSRLGFIPFFWIYEDTDQHLLERMVEVGFDDFLHISHKPHELLFRLRLRCRAAMEREEADKLLKEQSNRNARAETTLKQREEFLSVCAHDLRSPLGLIQSTVSMILNAAQTKPDFDANQTEMLTRVKRQATQAISLVNDLLDVMSFEQGLRPQYHLFNLHEVLQEFYNDYKVQAEQKQVGFHYNNTVQHWRVLADADRMRQLLQNLFTNALKFTENGKNIYLNVEAFTGRRKSDPDYPMIIISLRDEGKGIPQKEMERIFDKFSQIKDHSRPEGRGLGLTVAKQISTLHEGNIWVDSVEGQGSTFHVLFPHVISRTEPLTAVENARKVPQVVVAEPVLESRLPYQEEFTKRGYQVTFAKDGVEALAMMFHLMPDLLVLPTSLPKLESTEVVTIVKNDALTTSIPVVLVIGETEKGNDVLDTKKFTHVIRLPLNKEALDRVFAVSTIKAA